MMTTKQKKFVDEYLLTASATEAARRAGYSVHSARYQASKLLCNVEIRSAIEERRETMKTEKILTATQLQEFLSTVIRGEVQDEQLMTRLIGKGCSVVEKHKYTAAVKDRLRAVEILGKLIGAFDRQDENTASNIFISTLERISKELDGEGSP
mgnify:CR=1 FL=1